MPEENAPVAAESDHAAATAPDDNDRPEPVAAPVRPSESGKGPNDSDHEPTDKEQVASGTFPEDADHSAAASELKEESSKSPAEDSDVAPPPDEPVEVDPPERVSFNEDGTFIVPTSTDRDDVVPAPALHNSDGTLRSPAEREQELADREAARFVAAVVFEEDHPRDESGKFLPHQEV